MVLLLFMLFARPLEAKEPTYCSLLIIRESGAPEPFLLGDLAGREDIKLRKKVRQKIERIQNGEKLRLSELHKLASDLSEALTLPRDAGLLRALLPNRSSTRTALLKNFQREILTQDIVSAMQASGKVLDSGMFERFRLWAANHQTLLDWATTIGLNTVSIPITGLPTRFPSGRTLFGKSLPEDLLLRVRTEGFASVYPEIEKAFGSREQAAMAWNSIQGGFGAAMTIVIGYFLYKELMKMDAVADMLGVAKDNVMERERETFDAEEVRKIQFDSWKEATEEFMGRTLDPANAEDARLILDQRERLRNIPDSLLRISVR